MTCAAGSIRPTGAASPSSTRPCRRAADLRGGRADARHPRAIEPLLGADRAPMPPKQRDDGGFYSISNCQAGLRGVSFGNFLIKQVVEDLKRDRPPGDVRDPVARAGFCVLAGPRARGRLFRNARPRHPGRARRTRYARLGTRIPSFARKHGVRSYPPPPFISLREGRTGCFLDAVARFTWAMARAWNGSTC